MIIFHFRLEVEVLDYSQMVTFSYMDSSFSVICLTREVVVPHYAPHLPGIAAHNREVFIPFGVDLM